MITIRAAEERGIANMGWLNSKHTFSFGHYYDPQHMGFASLRVINEDRVKPGAGFGTHGHQDMEIISYVLDGALEHKDSIGTGSVIRPGDVQRMTAGTGIRHSEYNHSASDPVHFLQIWIMPEQNGLAPGYEQKAFTEEERRSRLRLIGSRDGRDGSVLIHQDVDLYGTLLDAGDEVAHAVAANRKIWVQVARGAVQVNGQTLNQGDGAALSDIGQVILSATETAEVLLFDMVDSIKSH
jgi:redox-sensitive bicupin YhaK (pirin superfamily)